MCLQSIFLVDTLRIKRNHAISTPQFDPEPGCVTLHGKLTKSEDHHKKLLLVLKAVNYQIQDIWC